jgi:predicted Zn-dependent protease with MMP-like domain
MNYDWDTMIQRALAKLAPEFREKVQNVAILVEDEPSTEVRKQEGLGEHETLLGLYTGIPLTERGEGYGVGVPLPDVIRLYTKPIREEAGSNDARDIERVVHETLWHEIGHYFGLDEHEVQKRERIRFHTS